MPDQARPVSKFIFQLELLPDFCYVLSLTAQRAKQCHSGQPSASHLYRLRDPYS